MEGEFIFDIMRLPRTQAQADLIAKQFADEAARWNSYIEDY